MFTVLTVTFWHISETPESISKMSSLEMELDAGEENLGDDILNLSTADIQARARLMDNEVNFAPLICGTFGQSDFFRCEL